MAASRAIYAGILVKSGSVEVTFAELRHRTERQREEDAFGLLRAEGLPDKILSVRRGGARGAIRAAAEHIVNICPKVRAIGVASYGPLLSVTLGDTDYGRISRSTVHYNLKGVPVSTIVHDVVNDARRVNAEIGEIHVRVHTDVMAGALCEAWLRQRPPSARAGARRYRQLGLREGLVFLHLAEGVGGAYIVGTKPFESGLHPEVGYIAPALEPKDPLVGERPQPIWLEDVASSTALRKRAEGRPIAEIDPDDEAWEYQVKYTARICATLALTLTPHQIVLHGPVVDEAAQEVDFLNRVREELQRWVEKLPEYPALRAETFIDSAMAVNPMLDGGVVLGALRDSDEANNAMSLEDQIGRRE